MLLATILTKLPLLPLDFDRGSWLELAVSGSGQSHSESPGEHLNILAERISSLGAAGTWLTQFEAGIGGTSIGNWLPFVAQVVQGVIAPPINHVSDMVGRR